MRNEISYRHFKVYKLHYAVAMDKDKGKENWKRAQELHKFKQTFNDKFCDVTYEQWYHIIFDAVKTGKDISERVPYLSAPDASKRKLAIEHGVYERNHDSLFIFIPLTRPDMIEFADSILPSWGRVVKHPKWVKSVWTYELQHKND